ncbi:MAG TPA: electron transfer flavoprotein subunit beta/FixA family protein [Longimicrobiales bacterium]|nr:electron transfer flavoprotein subunit beta/FixA family protein [Longimicrobiales bacterium]
MKIVVCIKRVPDTAARIKLAEGGVGIDPAGVKFVISPYDEFAMEAALRLKEAKGEGEIVALSLGDAAAGEQLRSALAMGADRAVLLQGESTMDGLVTARALAAELKDQGADLILFGMKASDGDQQQVGLMTAELMDLPAVSVVAELELEGGSVVCRREVEGGLEVLEAPLPAVVTMTKGPHEPRYPSLKGIMAAKKKPLEEKEAQATEARLEVRKLSYPPERPAGRIVGEGADAVPELVRLLREEAKVL